ncbi:hydroxymethylbilane synthase [Fulvivirga sp. RKSG066]|uniref:hydroxymethylbilane synthase n=1 Tax=Fulvivirga aurantia TaxID=2529383 RepID=UPI0012BD8076|nr:hydroxymethylbilane synthase [Fulvivirga aurantia]MTI23011.1 hydroxymethylbilane synthase [Fulvivirga aurantia]
MDKIRIGTRGSKLALWQAYHIQDLLKQGGIDSEIVTIETKGDKILDVSIAKIGSKGVFTEEIEDQLASGNIDIAVHSAKDMQSELPDGFELIAFTEREVVNDVLVGFDKSVSLDKEVIIGTSSTRRVATLKHYYPKVKTVAVRGNLQTRFRKMEEGACDAMLLAYAGVHRMGYHDRIIQKLSLDEFIPAVGQGSVTIECHSQLPQEKRDAIRKYCNHEETELRLLAERAYLKKLHGGCSIPVFALATLEGDQINIKGGIVDLAGKERIVKNISGDKSDANSIGTDLAEEVLSAGGDRILREIRRELGS